MGCSVVYALWLVLRLHGWQGCKMEKEEQSYGPRARLFGRFGMLYSCALQTICFSLITAKISFGMAPAASAFAIGFRTPVDHLFLTFFVLCGLTRLARFNITVANVPKDATGKSKYFEGTPIPTSLSIVALMSYWVSKGWTLNNLPLGTWAQGTSFEFHPVVGLFVLSGIMMTSKSIHIPKP